MLFRSEVAGIAQLADDPRFASNKARVAHRAELIPLLRQATVFKTTAQWIELLEKAGVPCGPINDLGQAFDLARRLDLDPVREVPSAAGGSVATIANPISLSRTPAAYRTGPPPFVPRSES